MHTRTRTRTHTCTHTGRRTCCAIRGAGRPRLPRPGHRPRVCRSSTDTDMAPASTAPRLRVPPRAAPWQSFGSLRHDARHRVRRSALGLRARAGAPSLRVEVHAELCLRTSAHMHAGGPRTPTPSPRTPPARRINTHTQIHAQTQYRRLRGSRGGRPGPGPPRPFRFVAPAIPFHGVLSGSWHDPITHVRCRGSPCPLHGAQPHAESRFHCIQG